MKIDNTELQYLPAPCCGSQPEIDDVGTFYELECSCGKFRCGVQISDLMSIDERVEDPFTSCTYKDEYLQRAAKHCASGWNTRYIPEQDTPSEFTMVPVEPTDTQLSLMLSSYVMFSPMKTSAYRAYKAAVCGERFESEARKRKREKGNATLTKEPTQVIEGKVVKKFAH